MTAVTTPDAKAKLAIMGHAVFDLAEGGFIVTRWGMARHCADVGQLAAFLEQIGGHQ
ncbi:hypothetical protein HF896_05300 [Alicycliphilus denitrificans]|uniref:Uncharacterized protein n=1 Tax=Alicycliphilus denitrificans TaxID=179636 RepID=A0A858ZQC2_9BURK|nr:hypothetical protein [Alicycliphilus denitrificans]QKD43060.1 hypothetical protein HF896_05300 [Alicycliphilus denitrificans]GAO20498.1 hypothetical protein ALISP_0318 [Alicycliphilus sp. B1]